MTIKFGELKGTRGQRSATFLGTGMNRYTRRFQAITDNPHTEQNAVYTDFMAWSGLIPGQHYKAPGIEDPFSFLNQINVDESEEDGYQWNITVSFAEMDPALIGGYNPTLAPVQKSINFEPREVPVAWVYTYDSDGNLVLDGDGNPVVTLIRNSTGDFFTTPVTRAYSEPVFRVTRNEQDFGVDLIGLLSQVMDTTNLYTWLGFPAKTLRFINADVTYMWHPRILSYYTVQYQFKIKWDTWIANVMDEGYKAVNPATGLIQPIMAPGGFGLVSTPQLLDGTGHLLPLATSPPTPPVFLPFEIYQPVNYGPLFNIS